MSKYKYWFLATRPWSFAMSAISVTVGGTLAATHGQFSVSLYFVTLSGIVLIHAAGNLLNDYFDVTGGIDTIQSGTARYRPHPLLEGMLTPIRVRNVALALLAAGGVLGVVLTILRGWPVLVIGLVGAFGALAYTAPPVKYKYIALGEVGVFLIWGPLMVEGAYFVQTRHLNFEPVWVSLPFGILVAQVLLANNLRDVSHDAGRGITTLATQLGKANALRLYLLLVVSAYAGVGVMAFFGPLTPWSLLVFLSVPLAWRLLDEMAEKIPEDADARTARLDTAFGLLLVASLILEASF
jgi:1,4-dihydroxy-2-naphthoate polyprenyltransferase